MAKHNAKTARLSTQKTTTHRREETLERNERGNMEYSHVSDSLLKVKEVTGKPRVLQKSLKMAKDKEPLPERAALTLQSTQKAIEALRIQQEQNEVKELKKSPEINRVSKKLHRSPDDLVQWVQS
jgi:hypothetical protein